MSEVGENYATYLPSGEDDAGGEANHDHHHHPHHHQPHQHANINIEVAAIEDAAKPEFNGYTDFGSNDLPPPPPAPPIPVVNMLPPHQEEGEAFPSLLPPPLSSILAEQTIIASPANAKEEGIYHTSHLANVFTISFR